MGKVDPGVKNPCKGLTPRARPINQDNLVAPTGLDHEASEFELPIAIVGFPIYARLVRHIVPQLISPVVMASSLDVGAKILATAGLSFLGLGTQPSTADCASMLVTDRQFVIRSPHVVLLPGSPSS